MSYFSKFSLSSYKFGAEDPNNVVAVNILTHARFLDLMPERSNMSYVDYIVKDGEKPEHIATRAYGRPDFHWVVLLSNRIYNPYSDWPLSQVELDAYCEKKYPGTALFFPCIGTQATEFFINNSSTTLSRLDSQFIVGNTVTQTLTTKTITGTIIEWDPTLRKLVVDDIENGPFVTTANVVSKNRNDVEFTIRPLKIVQNNQDAVRHFMDDFNNYLDPYAKIKYLEYDDNRIFAKNNIFLNNIDGLPTSETVGISGSNDFILNKYISGTQRNAITNRYYEELQNDAKRKIKVLKKDLVMNVVKKFETIFK
jgi:hypothetical protein